MLAYGSLSVCFIQTVYGTQRGKLQLEFKSYSIILQCLLCLNTTVSMERYDGFTVGSAHYFACNLLKLF
jgi:hypothetical protein